METTSNRSEIDELRSVRRQAAAWRLSLVIVLAIVVLSCIAQFVNAAHQLASDTPQRQQLVQLLGEGFQRDIVPQVQEVGTEAFESINFNEQINGLNKRAPEVAEAALKEMRLLSTNLPAKGRKAFADEFSKALDNQAVKLQEEFPDYSEEQIKSFLGALTTETHAQLGIVTDSLFAPHVESMNNIVADIDKIAGQVPASEMEMPTWQMALLIVDIARADFNLDAENASADAGAKVKANAAAAGKGKK